MNKKSLLACLISFFHVLSLRASDLEFEPLLFDEIEPQVIHGVDAAFFDNLAYAFAQGQLPIRENLFFYDTFGECSARRDRLCNLFGKPHKDFAESLGSFILFFDHRHGSFIGHREGQVRLRRAANFIKTSLPIRLKEIMWQKSIAFKLTDNALVARSQSHTTYSIKKVNDYSSNNRRLIIEIKEPNGTLYYGSCI